MKIFIVGGVSVKDSEDGFDTQIQVLQKSMNQLGAELARLGHEIVVCSPFEDSADFYVLEGISKYLATGGESKSSISIHYPDLSDVSSKMTNVCNSLGTIEVRRYPCPAPANKDLPDANQYSWLFAQLTGMDSSAVIIAIGGKPSGSLSLLFHLADARGKSVLPLTSLGGAALDYYTAHFFHLKDLLGTNFPLLGDESLTVKIETALDSLLIGRSTKSKNAFFISYSRARPKEADFVEALLRRRNHIVYRDEKDFEPAADTQADIIKNIKKANVFIALWCREYACSPWCADELQIAIDRLSTENAQLWIFCVDDTRIVPKQARSLNYYRVNTREEIEGRLIGLLDMLERQAQL